MQVASSVVVTKNASLNRTMRRSQSGRKLLLVRRDDVLNLNSRGIGVILYWYIIQVNHF